MVYEMHLSGGYREFSEPPTEADIVEAFFDFGGYIVERKEEDEEE